MEQHADEYNDSTERGSKVSIAWSVVTELQKSHGSRFLREDKHSGFWYEVSNIEARDKVSVGFRDMRKPKVRMEMETKNSSKRRAVQPITDMFVPIPYKRICKEEPIEKTDFFSEEWVNILSKWLMIDRID